MYIFGDEGVAFRWLICETNSFQIGWFGMETS